MKGGEKGGVLPARRLCLPGCLNAGEQECPETASCAGALARSNDHAFLLPAGAGASRLLRHALPERPQRVTGILATWTPFLS